MLSYVSYIQLIVPGAIDILHLWFQDIRLCTLQALATRNLKLYYLLFDNKVYLVPSYLILTYLILFYLIYFKQS